MTEQMTAADFLARNGQKADGAVLTGKKVQARGKGFEADLERTLAAYIDRGLACIEKLPVATQPMPRLWITPFHQKQSGICRILSHRAPFDYYGTIGTIPGRPELYGRAVAFEAKATGEAKRLEIGERGLKAHQLTACARTARHFGTITAIVWRCGERRLVLPTSEVLRADFRFRMRMNGSKGILAEKFVEYETYGGFEDILAPMLRDPMFAPVETPK